VEEEIEICIAQDINSSCLAQFCLQHCDLGSPLIGFFFEVGKPIPCSHFFANTVLVFTPQRKSENGRRIEKNQTRMAV